MTVFYVVPSVCSVQLTKPPEYSSLFPKPTNPCSCSCFANHSVCFRRLCSKLLLWSPHRQTNYCVWCLLAKNLRWNWEVHRNQPEECSVLHTGQQSGKCQFWELPVRHRMKDSSQCFPSERENTVSQSNAWCRVTWKQMQEDESSSQQTAKKGMVVSQIQTILKAILLEFFLYFPPRAFARLQDIRK